MVTTTTWKKVAWKAQVIILSCYQKTLAQASSQGGQGGQLTPPLRTKGPLFGTSCLKLLRPITING